MPIPRAYAKLAGNCRDWSNAPPARDARLRHAVGQVRGVAAAWPAFFSVAPSGFTANTFSPSGFHSMCERAPRKGDVCKEVVCPMRCSRVSDVISSSGCPSGARVRRFAFRHRFFRADQRSNANAAASGVFRAATTAEPAGATGTDRARSDHMRVDGCGTCALCGRHIVRRGARAIDRDRPLSAWQVLGL